MKRRFTKPTKAEKKQYQLLKEKAMSLAKTNFARDMAERVDIENIQSADIDMLILMCE